MKMLKLTAKNLIKYPQILDQISQFSLALDKDEETRWIKPAGLKTKYPMDKDDRYYNVGYILSGYYTAYVLYDTERYFRSHIYNVVAMLITNNNDSFANTMSLCYMYVHPQYRRHGYGKELMTKFLDTVPSNHNVLLNCFWNNQAAMKFYAACGFNRLRATFIRRGNKKGKKK